MFGRKKLQARISELESECESRKQLIDSLRKEKTALAADIDTMLYSNCDHEYQLVCAVVFQHIALVETGGLYSYGTNNPSVAKTYHHPYEDSSSDSDLIALYAYKCKNCQHLRPATCFDVAGVSDCEWVDSVGPLSYEGIKYMVCTNVVKGKKSNKLDSIIDECEKNDKTS